MKGSNWPLSGKTTFKKPSLIRVKCPWQHWGWSWRFSYWQLRIVLHLGNEDTLYNCIFLYRPHNQWPACNMLILLTMALSTQDISYNEILLSVALLVKTFDGNSWWKCFHQEWLFCPEAAFWFPGFPHYLTLLPSLRFHNLQWQKSIC